MVRGKGDKERIVPLCDDAIYWIELYINTKRKEKDPQRKCPFIFYQVRELLLCQELPSGIVLKFMENS